MNIGNDSFRIRIYDEDHPPPHCHIRRKDGTEIVVAIPTIEVIVGELLSKEERKMIELNLEELCDSWDSLNPKRQYKKK